MAMPAERPVMALKPFNAMRIPEIKAGLRLRNIRFKANGKKQFLYDLLVESMSAERIQSASCQRDLIKLQACVRGWLVRNRLRVHGAAIFNTSICNNAVDPVTLTELDDIPPKFLFSFSITRPDVEIPPDKYFSNPDQKVTYGFDVRSLKSLLEKTMTENPFTREPRTASTPASKVHHHSAESCPRGSRRAASTNRPSSVFTTSTWPLDALWTRHGSCGSTDWGSSTCSDTATTPGGTASVPHRRFVAASSPRVCMFFRTTGRCWVRTHTTSAEYSSRISKSCCPIQRILQTDAQQRCGFL